MSPRPSPLLPALQEIPETLPESPLPGGVAAVVRFFFHVPQWIQIGGAVLGAVVAAVVLVQLWRRRRRIQGWIVARQTGVKVGMLAALTLGLVAAGAFGKVSWDYMQHANEFCTGCHIMSPSFQRFADSEHSELGCHECHRQSIFASARQLYLWVLERPEEIGPHAPVANRVCAECHIRDDPEERWQRVAATAGHRVHLESDATALAGVMCVTCHGQEVHRFVPADQTCGQADCHAQAETRIVLGTMAGQTGLHCVTCHQFTAEVPERVPVDTAFAVLVPGRSQCFSCHDMQVLMTEFDAPADPHRAKCGACHDPHFQETPAEAFATCTAAGCHAQPETLSPFHRGIRAAVLEECGSCHAAHEWVVDGQDCAACHPRVAAAGSARSAAGFRHPWTGSSAGTGSRSRSSAPAPEPRSRLSAWGAAVHARGPAGDVGAAWPSSRDLGLHGGLLPQQERPAPFDHGTHRSLECTACHSSADTHGAVTASGRDCFGCHHSARVTARGCEACHGVTAFAVSRAVATELRLAVWDEPRRRSLPFDHAAHGELECVACHTGRTRLTAEVDCANCHLEHHRPEVACTACHVQPPAEAHTVAVHTEGCAGAGCHAPSELAYGALEKTRNLCLTCHQDQVDHEPGERCAICHLVPEEVGRAVPPAAGRRG